MNTRKYSIIAVLIICSAISSAQEVVSAGGNHHSSDNGSITYTIGEPVIQTFSGTGLILTQGFHQSTLNVTSLSDFIDFEVAAFPNPASDFLILRISEDKYTGLQYQLFDNSGTMLQTNYIQESETNIPFDNLPYATYILKVIDERREIMTFKIIKVQ